MIVVAVIFFLIGMATGIIVYCYTSVIRYEKDIEVILERINKEHQEKLNRKEEENKRLHDSLMEAQVKLAERKVRKNGN
jgi:hypothetical protein